jgi:hypothetical protein
MPRVTSGAWFFSAARSVVMCTDCISTGEYLTGDGYPRRRHVVTVEGPTTDGGKDDNDDDDVDDEARIAIRMTQRR